MSAPSISYELARDLHRGLFSGWGLTAEEVNSSRIHTDILESTGEERLTGIGRVGSRLACQSLIKTTNGDYNLITVFTPPDGEVWRTVIKPDSSAEALSAIATSVFMQAVIDISQART